MATIRGASNVNDHTVEVINFIIHLLGLPIYVAVHKLLHVKSRWVLYTFTNFATKDVKPFDIDDENSRGSCHR